jgi:hypothetical protein
MAQRGFFYADKSGRSYMSPSEFMESLAKGESSGGRELVFNERSGLLEVVNCRQVNPDQKVATDMAQRGFFYADKSGRSYMSPSEFMESLAKGESSGGRELVFNERSGRLEVVNSGQANPDQKVATDMAQQGFFKLDNHRAS